MARRPAEKGVSMRKELKDLLNKLIKLDERGIFFYPITEVQAPRYFDIIETPMDFSTMDKRLKSGGYDNANGFEEFSKDFRLICSNCMKYNPRGTLLHAQGRALLRDGEVLLTAEKTKLQRLMPGAVATGPPITSPAKKVSGRGRAPKRKSRDDLSGSESSEEVMPVSRKRGRTGAPKKAQASSRSKATIAFEGPATRKSILELLERLMQLDKSKLFSEPVNGEEVADYYEIIATPMDLSLMKSKATKCMYDTAHAPIVPHPPANFSDMKWKLDPEDPYVDFHLFQSDFELIFANCLQYNGTTGWVARAAKALQKLAVPELAVFKKAHGLLPPEDLDLIPDNDDDDDEDDDGDNDGDGAAGAGANDDDGDDSDGTGATTGVSGRAASGSTGAGRLQSSHSSRFASTAGGGESDGDGDDDDDDDDRDLDVDVDDDDEDNGFEGHPDRTHTYNASSRTTHTHTLMNNGRNSRGHSHGHSLPDTMSGSDDSDENDVEADEHSHTPSHSHAQAHGHGGAYPLSGSRRGYPSNGSYPPSAPPQHSDDDDLASDQSNSDFGR